MEFVGPEKYRPISSWGYVGFTILFSIPLFGWLLVIVYSVSDFNINLRNYARSYICWLILSILLLVALYGIMGAYILQIMEILSTSL